LGKDRRFFVEGAAVDAEISSSLELGGIEANLLEFPAEKRVVDICVTIFSLFFFNLITIRSKI
jgi:hypothetical protein